MLAFDKVTGRVVRIIRATESKKVGLVSIRLPDGSRSTVISSQLVVL